MSDNFLVVLSKEFAVDIIKLTSVLRKRGQFNSVIDQLLRSGTSIGANIHEGNYAASRADFINKFQIALKECFETEYWLEIFKESGILSGEEYGRMFLKCTKLRRLLSASIQTAKKNREG